MPQNLLTKKLKQLEKKVNNIIDDIEYKYKDGDYQWSMVGTSIGTVSGIGLQSIPSGTQISERIGREISVSSIRFRGFVQYGDAYNKYRILVVQLPTEDRSINGVSATDILANMNDWYNSFYRRNSDVKFKVLADRRGRIMSYATGGSSANISTNAATQHPSFQPLNMNFKFKSGLKVSYSSDALSSPTKNDIKIILLANSTLPDHPDYKACVRITYTDA